MESIKIEDKNGKIYEFEKPEFDCELLTVYGTTIIGRIYSKSADWSLKGKHSVDFNYDIKPIK